MKKSYRIRLSQLLMTGIVYILSICCEDDNATDNITDTDGNAYKTVIIGSQVWMAENLKTRKYNDGTDITSVIDINVWIDLTTGAYCDYNITPSNSEIYGRLYNWHAVNTGKLCPAGWHVPSNEEWTALTSQLGGENVAGGKLKEAGTIHWSYPNTGATNSSGFTALPCGGINPDGIFFGISLGGMWWSTSTITEDAWFWYAAYNDEKITMGTGDLVDGFSVRCIKD